jgi:hypothetical protein
MRLLLALIIMLVGSGLGVRPASAALFGSEGLDPSFCNKPALRQTVVYVDDQMMTDGRTEWATKLSTKLRATLSPGERVTVVRLSPATGQSDEVWNGCWPAYGAAERQRLASNTYVFSQSPLSALEDQQKYFMRDLSGALGAVYLRGKRPASDVVVDGAHPPAKDLLRALASDEGRFSQSQITIRAIVYSDMAENSDLGSVFKPLAAPPENFGKRLGTYLRRSVFYLYGLGEDVTNAPGAVEATRRFWAAALHSMNANVAGMGADLNMPNVIPVSTTAYALTLRRDGEELDGRLSMMVDADGTLVDSWIGVSRLSISGLAGTYRCAPEDGACRLDATTNTGLATSSTSETLAMTGTERTGLTGQLGVKGALVYPIKATRIEK